MRLGFISTPLAGHLNPMTALGRKLKSRGHEVVFIGVPDVESIVKAADLDFIPFCEQEFPAGAVSKGYAGLAKLHGLAAVEYAIREMHPKRCRAALQHLPEKLSAANIDALVIDTIHFFVELVPMRLGMPYVHVSNVLHLDMSGQTPPCFLGWPHETSSEALTSAHKCLRICDLCKELAIVVCARILQRSGSGKPRPTLVWWLFCPLTSMVPVFWR